MTGRIEIGKIVNTHGIRGEVKVIPWCDDSSVFKTIGCVFDKDGTEYKIKNVKYQKANVILAIDGIDDMNNAERLKNKILYVDRSALGELPEGSYFVQDLLGLTAVTAEGEVLGEVVDWFETGSNDVYTIRTGDGKLIYIPFIADVVGEVDLEKGTMEVTLIEGLIDD